MAMMVAVAEKPYMMLADTYHLPFRFPSLNKVVLQEIGILLCKMPSKTKNLLSMAELASAN
jgi:hypothetical protein